MKEFFASNFGRRVLCVVLAGAAFVAGALVDDARAQVGLLGLGTTMGALAVNLGGRAKDEGDSEGK